MHSENKQVNILDIEDSGDETAARVAEGRIVKSSVIASQTTAAKILTKKHN